MRCRSRRRAKNRIHLDLTTTTLADQRETVEQLVEFGARHVDIGQGPDDEHVVLADPEGNELCVIEPGNNFLADCAVSDRSPATARGPVGCFWSEVLGWPLVWDQDEETAIRAGRDRPFITWGPPLVPKSGKNRLHLEIAPTGHAGQRAELDRLVALAATPLDISHGAVDRAMMTEPDDNEFCVPRPRQRA